MCEIVWQSDVAQQKCISVLRDLGEEATGNGVQDGEEEKWITETTCTIINFCDNEQHAHLLSSMFTLLKWVSTPCLLSYLMGGETLKRLLFT